MEKKSWAIILINGLHTDTHITKGGSGNSFLLSPFHPSYVSRPLEDKWILSYQGIEKTCCKPGRNVNRNPKIWFDVRLSTWWRCVEGCSLSWGTRQQWVPGLETEDNDELRGVAAELKFFQAAMPSVASEFRPLPTAIYRFSLMAAYVKPKIY